MYKITHPNHDGPVDCGDWQIDEFKSNGWTVIGDTVTPKPDEPDFIEQLVALPRIGTSNAPRIADMLSDQPSLIELREYLETDEGRDAVVVLRGITDDHVDDIIAAIG